MSSRPLTDYTAYLFDVDGTLLYPGQAIPGAGDALRTLKRWRKRILAVTNNSSLARHEIAARFRDFGLPLKDEEVFSALTATAQFVAHERPGARVHVFGNPGLRAEIKRLGLVVTDDVEADYLVVGNNRHVSYDSLTRAMRALLGGARFVAVNADRSYVGPDGGLVPGAGVFVAGLERATGRAPDAVVGKPSTTILCEAAASVGSDPRDCLYVGDNLEADVAGAHAAGMDALLVLSGVTTAADPLTETPEHVLPSVADLAGQFS